MHRGGTPATRKTTRLVDHHRLTEGARMACVACGSCAQSGAPSRAAEINRDDLGKHPAELTHAYGCVSCLIRVHVFEIQTNRPRPEIKRLTDPTFAFVRCLVSLGRFQPHTN